MPEMKQPGDRQHVPSRTADSTAAPQPYSDPPTQHWQDEIDRLRAALAEKETELQAERMAYRRLYARRATKVEAERDEARHDLQYETQRAAQVIEELVRQKDLLAKERDEARRERDQIAEDADELENICAAQARGIESLKGKESK